MVRSFRALLAVLCLLLPWEGALAKPEKIYAGEHNSFSIRSDSWLNEGPEPPPNTRLGDPVSATAQVDQLSPYYSGCGGATAPLINYSYEQSVVELVNAERANVGLPPLKRVVPLDQAARYHAADMAQDDYFSHTTYDVIDGELVSGCNWSTRVSAYYPSWNALSENIAAGYTSPASAMAGWMNSPDHKTNILRSTSWEIGVGYSSGGSYGHYWVQDFGRRNGVYPLVINREAASLEGREASIYIYGSWSEMRLRNDGGDWSEWMPFQQEFSWTLGSGVGDHIVSAEVRNGSTTIATSDEIFLAVDNSAPVLGNLPDQVGFLYRMSDGQLLPESVELTPLNTGNNEMLEWSASQSGSWFTLSPDQGATPQKLTIAPNGFNTGSPQVYSGSVTVTVTSPAGAQGSPHTIQLSLFVIEDTAQAYLPAIRR